MLNDQKHGFILLLIVLFLFPSCIKYYKISNIEFHQGHDHKDERVALDGNKKSLVIYDEFITKAIFNVLYLSDSVRMAYVNKHCEKNGLDDLTKKALQKKELELNKFWITFYVLADIRDKIHNSLTDNNSSWSLYLKLQDGNKIAPLSIKEVDLPPEYQYLFGSLFNTFERCYEVKFPAKNLNNINYLGTGETFKFFVSSSYKESSLTFNEPRVLLSEEKKSRKGKIKKEKKRKILKDEDFYWI